LLIIIKKIVVNYNKNSYLLLNNLTTELNNYTIELMIEFSDQLS